MSHSGSDASEKELLHSNCDQGNSYDGHFGEICGKGVWGKTDVEVWYPTER